MRQINLLPEQFQKSEYTKLIRKALLVILAPFIVLFLFLHLLLSFEVNRLVDKINNPLGQIETPEINKLSIEIAEMEASMENYISGRRLIIEILNKRLPYSSILKGIGDACSGKAWLNELIIKNENESAQIKGNAYNVRLASEFMLELKKKPYFESIDITTMDQDPELGGKAVGFAFTARLK